MNEEIEKWTETHGVFNSELAYGGWIFEVWISGVHDIWDLHMIQIERDSLESACREMAAQLLIEPPKFL